jgi:hypothetical protein
VKKIAIATLALGAVISSLGSIPAASAAPSTTGVDGLLCNLALSADPGAEPGTQTGELTGGPALIDDGATPPGVHSGRFVCSVHVGNNTYAGAAAAVVEGPTTVGVIAAAGRVSFEAGPTDNVYICTEMVVDGTHLYFDGANGSFDTNPTVSCYWDVQVCDDCGVGSELDSVVCPLFALALPPEGDVVLPDPVGKVWDCPPYDG